MLIYFKAPGNNTTKDGWHEYAKEMTVETGGQRQSPSFSPDGENLG